MNDFHYVNDELWCEGVPIKVIAEEVGTPVYIYSSHTLRRHFRVFDGALAQIRHLTCFAVKANSNLAVLNLIAREGGGVDIVSGGELYRSLKAGVDPQKIVYSGVGKRDDEIIFALDAGILMFNIESLQELSRINQLAGERGKRAQVALRVNPDVNPETHPYISTGLKENKFGIDISDAREVYKYAQSWAHIDLVGISCHIGSQLTKVAPFVDALERLKHLEAALRDDGIVIRYLDLGEGWGSNTMKKRHRILTIMRRQLRR